MILLTYLSCHSYKGHEDMYQLNNNTGVCMEKFIKSLLLLTFILTITLNAHAVCDPDPNDCVGVKGLVETQAKTHKFVETLRSQEKFFGYHDEYHYLIEDLSDLLALEAQEDRLLMLMEILDPEENSSSLKEAFQLKLEEIGLDQHELTHLMKLIFKKK